MEITGESREEILDKIEEYREELTAAVKTRMIILYLLNRSRTK